MIVIISESEKASFFVKLSFMKNASCPLTTLFESTSNALTTREKIAVNRRFPS